MEGLLVVWKDFLWIWKDLRDVEGFGKVSGDLEEFGRIWKSFLGSGRISVPLERIGGAFGQRWDG